MHGGHWPVRSPDMMMNYDSGWEWHFFLTTVSGCYADLVYESWNSNVGTVLNFKLLQLTSSIMILYDIIAANDGISPMITVGLQLHESDYHDQSVKLIQLHLASLASHATSQKNQSLIQILVNSPCCAELASFERLLELMPTTSEPRPLTCYKSRWLRMLKAKQWWAFVSKHCNFIGLYNDLGISKLYSSTSWSYHACNTYYILLLLLCCC